MHNMGIISCLGLPGGVHQHCAYFFSLSYTAGWAHKEVLCAMLHHTVVSYVLALEYVDCPVSPG